MCAGNDKSIEEQAEEEYLIQRKLDIVNQRNSIIESIDEDRLRLVAYGHRECFCLEKLILS